MRAENHPAKKCLWREQGKCLCV